MPAIIGFGAGVWLKIELLCDEKYWCAVLAGDVAVMWSYWMRELFFDNSLMQWLHSKWLVYKLQTLQHSIGVSWTQLTLDHYCSIVQAYFCCLTLNTPFHSASIVAMAYMHTFFPFTVCWVNQGMFVCLQELKISHCINVTDEGVLVIASHCPKLTVLVLHGCPQLTERSRELIGSGKLSKLKQITWTVY